jgi:hypothetical protein
LSEESRCLEDHKLEAIREKLTNDNEINELKVNHVVKTPSKVKANDSREILLDVNDLLADVNEINEERYQSQIEVENSKQQDDKLVHTEDWIYWKVRPPPKRKK